MTLSWTQPCCDRCWLIRNPSRRPDRIRYAPRERCCLCGQSTRSGIYIRINPRTVAYPRPEREAP